MNICIFTHKREESFWEVYNSIIDSFIEENGEESLNQIHIFKDGKDFLYSEDFYEQGKLDGYNVTLRESKEQMGISWQKEEARKVCKGDHTFFIEDDCVVTNTSVFEICVDWSEKTGLKHFNWNSYRYPSLGVVEVQGEIFEVSKECEASFQFFHKDIMEAFIYDHWYKNALDHVDVEMQLCKKHLQPPFRLFCSPSGLEEMLQQNNVPSTIEYEDDDLEIATSHWVGKWGRLVSLFPEYHIERAIPSLERIHKDHHKVIKRKGGRSKKPLPVSVVVTIKDRSLFYYKTPKDVLPEEYVKIKSSDKEMSLVDDLNRGKGLKKSSDYMKDPNGFRPFDNFLKSLNKQASIFKGDVELVVVDWQSRDDDVEELIKCFWTHSYRYITMPYSERFSRGYALNLGTKLAKHGRIHVSDVDLQFFSPEVLEDTSSLNEDEVSFPIMLKEHNGPSGFVMRFEVASFGLASFHKSTHTRVGGYPDYRKWGLEDQEFANACIDAVGVDNYRRPKLMTASHQWHSDNQRDL